MSSNFCPHCGKPLPPNAKFCGECGEPIIEKADTSESAKADNVLEPVKSDAKQNTAETKTADTALIIKKQSADDTAIQKSAQPIDKADDDNKTKVGEQKEQKPYPNESFAGQNSVNEFKGQADSFSKKFTSNETIIKVEENLKEDIYTTKERLNRKAFVINWISANVIGLIGVGISATGILAIIGIPVLIASTIASIMFGIRRLHDIGHSGWFLLGILIPYLGWLGLLYMFLKKGTTGPNKYGPDPLQQ